MIDLSKFKPMSSAPKGPPIMVAYREFNEANGKLKIQAAQWLCDNQGNGWTWRAPWRVDTTAYALGWLTIEELIALQDAPEPEGFDL